MISSISGSQERAACAEGHAVYQQSAEQRQSRFGSGMQNEQASELARAQAMANKQISFASAATMESLSMSERQVAHPERRSNNPLSSHQLPTKQFRADFELDSNNEETTLRLNKGQRMQAHMLARRQAGLSHQYRSPSPPRTVFPCGKLSLERQPCGTMVDFDLYNNCDLPFLDSNTEVGRMVSQNIVQQNLDDDVMTDDEMIMCADKILKREVEKAIKMFNHGL